MNSLGFVRKQPWIITLVVLAVLIGGPNVSQISEHDATIVIMRVAHQPRFASKRREGGDKKQSGGEDSGSLFHGS